MVVVIKGVVISPTTLYIGHGYAGPTIVNANSSAQNVKTSFQAHVEGTPREN